MVLLTRQLVFGVKHKKFVVLITIDIFGYLLSEGKLG